MGYSLVWEFESRPQKLKSNGHGDRAKKMSYGMRGVRRGGSWSWSQSVTQRGQQKTSAFAMFPTNRVPSIDPSIKPRTWSPWQSSSPQLAHLAPDSLVW